MDRALCEKARLVTYSTDLELGRKEVYLYSLRLNPRAGKMKRILRSNWLPERARWAHLARSGFPALVPQEQVLFLAV